VFEYAPVFLLGSTESFQRLFVVSNLIVHDFTARGSWCSFLFGTGAVKFRTAGLAARISEKKIQPGTVDG